MRAPTTSPISSSSKPPRSRWLELLRGSLAQQIIRQCRRHQRSCARRQRERGATEARAAAGARAADARIDISAYAGSLAGRVGAGRRRSLLHQMLGVSNVALVFLTAVLASAVTYGLWPALFACLVSVLAYNFFFLPPLYTFTIADPENVVALFFFASSR